MRRSRAGSTCDKRSPTPRASSGRARALAAGVGRSAACWRHGPRLRDLRERPRAPAGAVAGWLAALRLQHPRRAARDLRDHAQRAASCRVGARGARAGGGGGPQRHRSVGREPALRQRERGGRPEPARHPHAARRRRAARHRVRGPGPEPRLRHDGAPRPAAHRSLDRRRARRGRSAAHDAGRPARGRLGLRRREPRRHAGRYTASDRPALRRHAARAGARAWTAAASTPPSSTRATAAPRSTRAVSATASPPPTPCTISGDDRAGRRRSAGDQRRRTHRRPRWA